MMAWSGFADTVASPVACTYDLSDVRTAASIDTRCACNGLPHAINTIPMAAYLLFMTSLATEFGASTTAKKDLPEMSDSGTLCLGVLVQTGQIILMQDGCRTLPRLTSGRMEHSGN